MPHVTVDELERRRGDVALIDVRARSEYEAGHLPDAINIPLPELSDRIDEVPTDAPVVLHCQGGGRSAIAAALLQARGRRNVSNLTGGYSDWVRRQRANAPTTH
jgi:hydroxyacylglutathione hydrolase